MVFITYTIKHYRLYSFWYLYYQIKLSCVHKRQRKWDMCVYNIFKLLLGACQKLPLIIILCSIWKKRFLHLLFSPRTICNLQYLKYLFSMIYKILFYFLIFSRYLNNFYCLHNVIVSLFCLPINAPPYLSWTSVI